MASIYRKRTTRRRLILAVLLAVSVMLITFDFRSGGESSGLRKAMLEIVQPIESVVAWVTRPIGDFFTGLINSGNLERETELLREENEQLRKELIEVARLERENEELTELTNLQNPFDFDFVTARIVGVPATNFDNSISLDAGTSNGIADRNPVVSGEGLVGRVIDATSRGSKVLLLTDPQSSVAVRNVRSAVNGVVTGQGGGQLSLEFVDANADVEAGDVFVTSGFEGSRYPANIPVGKVTKVDTDKSGLVLAVQIELFVDATQRDFVSVLLWTPSG